MSRISICFLLPLLLCATPAIARDNHRDTRPNIVVLVGDDHGYPYSGFMGDQIVETPNLDRLADEGTTFTHAFSSSSVCRPALQTLLSGLHGRTWFAQRSRLQEELTQPIPFRAEVEHYVTLPRQLARQGYTSFQGGKHWEGDFETSGFDAGTATHQAAGGGLIGAGSFARPSLLPMEDFLDGVEEDEPFLLFLSPMLPHTPFDASADLVQRYLAMGLSFPAARYYANITRFDDVVGQVLDTLDARGLRDNTLIVYVSDNGWEQGPFETHFLGSIIGGDRGKLSIFDLGFRTPLIFNWPGQVPARTTYADQVTFKDLHATLLQYGGVPIPPDHRGYDLVPRVEGWGEATRDHIIGVQDGMRVRESEFDPATGLKGMTTGESGSFLRTEQWRFVEWLDRGEQALYEIEVDPFERNDVSADHPELLAEFAERTRIWREELIQPTEWMDLMGQLEYETGGPGGGLRLWLDEVADSGDLAQFEILSDDRGFFRFPNVPAGDYTLTYEIEVAPPSLWWAPVQAVTATTSVSIDLNGYPTSPFLSLQVPGDAPPAQAGAPTLGTIEVELRTRDQSVMGALPVEIGGWTARGIMKQHVLSGPDGFVAVDQLPAGIYYIRVSSKDGEFSRTRWLRLGQDETKLAKIRIGRKFRRDRRHRISN